MPEGDSLHRAAQKLRPVLVSQPVTSLQMPRFAGSTEGLRGKVVEGVEARGKNLLVHFEGGLSLHVHLKMHGRIRVVAQVDPAALPQRHVVALLRTERHAVVVQHAPVCRLIHRRDLVRDFHFRHLGPDLLAESFDADEALRRLRLRNERPLGEALMDQSAVAGIGNVWKSELCFNRKLDPFAATSRYADEELAALLEHARTKMRDNVYAPKRRMPDPFSPPSFRRRARVAQKQGEGSLSVYERAGEPCFDCGTSIRMERQGESLRSTYYCPRCQHVEARA